MVSQIFQDHELTDQCREQAEAGQNGPLDPEWPLGLLQITDGQEPLNLPEQKKRDLEPIPRSRVATPALKFFTTPRVA
jgi:hypothetical protein